MSNTQEKLAAKQHHKLGDLMYINIQSLDAKGNQLTAVNQVPAFYALLVNGQVVEYYTTIQALNQAVSVLKVVMQSQEFTQSLRKVA